VGGGKRSHKLVPYNSKNLGNQGVVKREWRATKGVGDKKRGKAEGLRAKDVRVIERKRDSCCTLKNAGERSLTRGEWRVN